MRTLRKIVNFASLPVILAFISILMAVVSPLCFLIDIGKYRRKGIYDCNDIPDFCDGKYFWFSIICRWW